MTTSEAGIELIKQSEGLRLEAYQDSAGVWTIGYGNTYGVREGDTCTQEWAEERLQDDVRRAEAHVTRLVKLPLMQGQFDALVSFVFNLGYYALFRSTLLRKLNAGDYSGAADEFLRWNHAGGKVLKGLTRRREAERHMFLGGSNG
jgi:lysozyme